MTRRAPHVASWLLQRFAFGPQRESLIGDILEQYDEGGSSTWYMHQALVTVFVGSVARVRHGPRRALRAAVLIVIGGWFLAAVGRSAFLNTSSYGWFDLVMNLVLLGYCSIGLFALMLTITGADEPLSLT